MAAGEKTGSLLEWGVWTVLIAVTGLAGILLPLFNFIAEVFMPLPAILLVLRFDVRYSILGLSVAACLMVFAGLETSAALIMILRYGLLGVVCGLFFKNKVSGGKSFAAVLITAVLLTVASVALLYALTGSHPLALAQEERSVLEQEWLAMNQQMRLLEDVSLEEQAKFSKYWLDLFEFYLAGQFVVAAAYAAALTYILAVLFLRRLRHEISSMPIFSVIYLPWYSIWGLIIALGCILLGDQYSQTLAQVGKNIMFVLVNIYFVMGLSVLTFYYKKINVALPLKLIILFLIVSYLPISVMVLLLLGAADPLINFRRLPELK